MSKPVYTCLLASVFVLFFNKQMGVVSDVTRMARGWLAVSNPGYVAYNLSMIMLSYVRSRAGAVGAPVRFFHVKL